MSMNIGRCVSQGSRTFTLVGAIALLVFAGCSSAKVGAETKGGDGGNGSGSGGNHGGTGGCGLLGCGDGSGGSTSSTGVTINLKNCGDGKLDVSAGEGCDDGNKEDKDGCSKICQLEANWLCPKPGEKCEDQRKCGNGILTSDEMCDDKNEESGDGCSKDCKSIEEGYECRVPGQRCTPKCGDGKIIGGEKCDDGNDKNEDGCSSTCQIEPGADCPEAGKSCKISECGNGVKETGEKCDCGDGSGKLPDGCPGPNGLFYGDGKGCSKTCTLEPSCVNDKGETQACSTSCGDGNRDSNEDCDDGNQVDDDGCSKDCKVEKDKGFTCSDKQIPDSSECKDSANGKDCLRLPVIYRDFQPENAASGGHPDFFFLGTKFNGSKSPTTICVPNSGGPGKGNDSTKRCWGIMADKLSKGKPQPGKTLTCDCQFSDWSIANSGRIAGNYTAAGNDSPLSDGAGGYLGGTAGTTVSTTSTAGKWTGTLVKYTASTPGGPVWAGTVPAYKDAASFNQWFTDDDKVNKKFTDVIEMAALKQLSNGTTVYQYKSKTEMASKSFAGTGFYPLDTLNKSQATLCNLWPYWNHGSGKAIWGDTATTCTGDQYLFTPRVTATDCASGDTLDDGCWVVGVTGQLHNNWFTDEARYYFVYNKDTGIELKFFGDDDLFIFINGQLVLDLGGVHQQLPGKVTVTGDPGKATVVEGGCLDSTGEITGAAAGSVACAPANANPKPTATEGADFRNRTVDLGLQDGKVYEIAIFGADRHPPESNYQLTLNGYATKRSDCSPRCGDGKVSAGEECDCGDGSEDYPKDRCAGKNDDERYGGCTTKCKFGPFCGDNIKNGDEKCDKGKDNGSNVSTPDGCTFGCTIPHYCGDQNLDTDRGEECDLGTLNGKKVDAEGKESEAPEARERCNTSCQLVIVNSH
jgi:cysteine-rich repeat protein